MEIKLVNSSSIHSVGYSAKEQLLHITFNSGRTYAYEKVPLEIANALLTAESKGKYFAEFIREKFQYKCLNPLPPKEPTDAKAAPKAKAAKKTKLQPI